MPRSSRHSAIRESTLHTGSEATRDDDDMSLADLAPLKLKGRRPRYAPSEIDLLVERRFLQAFKAIEEEKGNGTLKLR